jgi:hypothetical protein
MNKNVVDGFGDEYFINEYVGGLYIHNGLLYQLKGFNVNGVYIKGAKRYAEASGLTKATFGSLEALREWLKRQRAHLETMQEYPPDQYYTYEDDDGDMVESDEHTDEWEDWNEEIRSMKELIENGEKLENSWNVEENETNANQVCLEFTPISNPRSKQLLININDFTSLKGFKLQQGWINVKNRLFSINGRRCHKINDNTVKMLQENPKYAEQFINPTYPTLKEALEMLKKGDDLDAVAISRKVRLSKETRYKENGEVYRIKWRLESLTGEELAGWVEGNKTIWAKNNKVFSYINKKG